MNASTIEKLEEEISNSVQKDGFWSRPISLFSSIPLSKTINKLRNFPDCIFFISKFIKEIKSCDFHMLDKIRYEQIPQVEFGDGIAYICSARNFSSLDGANFRKIIGSAHWNGIKFCIIENATRVSDSNVFIVHIDFFPEQKNIDFYR